jgi:hypothetical protein
MNLTVHLRFLERATRGPYGEECQVSRIVGGANRGRSWPLSPGSRPRFQVGL